MSTMQQPSNLKSKHSYIRMRSAKESRVGKVKETESVMDEAMVWVPIETSLASQHLAICITNLTACEENCLYLIVLIKSMVVATSMTIKWSET